MGGTLAVRSAPGQGCCMTLTLSRLPDPVAADMLQAIRGDEQLPGSPASFAQAPKALSESALPERHILLVEDDLLVAEAMTRLLGSWGQQVHHVETAEQAFAQAELAEIAICDVRLPGRISGLDVALKLRNSGKSVLLISGETAPALREAAVQHGLLMLTKPVSAARLWATLNGLPLNAAAPATANAGIFTPLA
jgi:two-component system, sensor histidine kinase